MRAFSWGDFGWGLLIGIGGFYGLSLGSGLWVDTVADTRANFVWAMLISVAACCILGVVVAVRSSMGLGAGVSILLIGAIGLVVGSSDYIWILPIPYDFQALFFHGGRSPLVFGGALFLTTTGAVLTARAAGSRHAARDIGDDQRESYVVRSH